MAKLTVNTGTSANSRDGDSLRAAFTKINANFTELYDRAVNTDAQTLTLTGNTLAITGGNSVELNISPTGDLKGSVFADDSTLLVDGVNASIPYSVLSGAPTIPVVPTALSSFTNDTGFITAADIPTDFKGSVFADDSTLLVDGVNGTIPYSVLSGAPTIPADVSDLTDTGNLLSGDTGNWTFSSNTLSENSTGDAVIQSSTFAGSKLILQTRGPTDKQWIFDQDGDLTFPDATVQTTAWTGTLSSIDSIGFDTSAGVSVTAGQLAWNSSDGTLDLGTGYADVVLQIGQETHFVVRNATGSTIPNGTAVYCSGVTSGSARIEASPFVADNTVDSTFFLGIATHSITNGVNGLVTHFGYVRGLDTRGTANTSISVGDENWSVGDKLYAHPTAAGKLTNVEPTLPDQKICVASIMSRHQSVGVLFVRPTQQIPTDLSELTNDSGVITTGILKIDDGVHEKFQTKADATGTVTHDCSSGHIFYHTSPDANWTANFTNLSLSSTYATSVTIVIVQGATPYGPNALQIGGSAQTILWQGGTAPSGTANGVDVVTFSILNNSGTYTVLGQLTDFAAAV